MGIVEESDHAKVPATMTPERLDLLLRRFHQNPAASDDSIRRAEKALGVALPGDFRTFLAVSNGGQGMIGETYLILFKAEELADMNTAYEIATYAPGLLLVGSDGGGEAFAFDMRVSPSPVVSMPFVGMEPELAEVMAPTFDAFLEGLAV